MRRFTGKYNLPTVPVLDNTGNPLSPTRPSRARKWVEIGKAVKVWKHGRFAVQLTRKHSGYSTPVMELGIDPGADKTGMAVSIITGVTKTLVSGNVIKHRGKQIIKAMIVRKMHRRNRRSRLRYRPARFNNRTRKKGWLPPSLQSTLSNILTNARHLCSLYPVTSIVVESCKFNPRLMQDPDMWGVGYQQSERGKMQVREYVLQRDNRTCQYCGVTNVRLEIDHIVPVSKGGSYRVSNLVTACHNCNQSKGNRSLSEFLQHDPARLRKIRAQLKQSLSSATHMNRLMPVLLDGLSVFNVPVNQSDAVTTAYTRNKLGIPKTHVNDAACLGEPEQVLNIHERITVVKSVGHGKMQMLTPTSKHGTPRYTDNKNCAYKTYCRLPKEIQGFTVMPGHKQRRRRVKGITSGDLVMYTHPKNGEIMGYANLVQRNTRAAVVGHMGVMVNKANLLGHGNGYKYSTGLNE